MGQQAIFETEHLKTDLKGRSVRGGAVTLIGQGGRFLVYTASTMILARLLTPEDFGLIAMVTALTGFAALFKDLGLSMATVQKAEISHEQVSVLFWINVVVSVLIALVTVTLSPVIAWFYGEPRLASVAAVLSVTFVFGGLTVQHQAILRRQMRFLALAVIPLGSMAFGVIAALIAAGYGMGYWALVVMHVTTPLANMMGVWIICHWLPSWPRRGGGVRGMLRFGANLTGFNILNYFARNLDNVLIGRVWGPVSLGFYAKAYGLLMLPLSQINAPIAAVAIPALSRLQDEPERYRAYYIKTISLIAFLTMPLIGFLVVMSRDVIQLALGPQWLEASRVFAFLGIAGLLQPIGNSTGWLFVSQDRTQEMLRWGLIGGLITVASIVVGLPWGILGVAASYAVVGVFIRMPLLLFFVSRNGPIRMRDFCKVVVVPGGLCLSVISGLAFFFAYATVFGSLLRLTMAFGLSLLIVLIYTLVIPSAKVVLGDIGECISLLYPHRVAEKTTRPH